MTAVQDALRERDAVGLREAAHKLYGMVAAFSSVAGGVASDLEDRAASGPLEECRPLVERGTELAWELVSELDGLPIGTLRTQAVAAFEPDRGVGPGTAERHSRPGEHERVEPRRTDDEGPF